MRRRRIASRGEARLLLSFIGILCIIIGALGLAFFVGLVCGKNPIVTIVFIGGFALFLGCYCLGSGFYIFYTMIKRIKSNDTDYDNWI